MTTAINNTYINALLADASYSELSNQNGVLSESEIKARLALRLTQPLADFINNNFEVLDQSPVNDGFSPRRAQ